MTADVWWQQFSVQALGGAAGALLVSALLSALSPTVREKFWRPIGRGLRWLTTLRLTTTSRVAAAREKADAAAQEQKRQHDELVRQLNLLHEGRVAEERAQARSIGVVEARAEAEIYQAAAVDKARAEGHAAGRAEGLAAARAEAASRTPAPARVDVVVEPVWVIHRMGPREYWLENVQDGVGELTDVKIDAVIGEFSFSSGNQWPGAWGRGAGFSGDLVSTGTAHGARMAVSWTGPNGRRRKADARIEPPPREPRRGIIL